MNPQPPVTIIKLDGTKEPFDEEKLANSLARAGANKGTISDITNQVSHELKDGMSTVDIYTHAFDLLRKHHHPTAVKYSLRRAMFELGPDGFPFERYVSRIFKLWGYETLTDQMVMGACVPHEVDVVAWKGDELAMVEAKFHNEIALRSDLKVVLYVKARYDDLSKNMYNFGGKERHLSQDGRWLVTNTKFTDVAVKYGTCNGLKLLGWNFPMEGNLHDLIEENGLHPITCLSALSSNDKKNLIGLNVLTCIDVIGKPEILNKIGLKPDVIERVLTECQMVVEQAK